METSGQRRLTHPKGLACSCKRKSPSAPQVVCATSGGTEERGAGSCQRGVGGDGGRLGVSESSESSEFRTPATESVPTTTETKVLETAAGEAWPSARTRQVQPRGADHSAFVLDWVETSGGVTARARHIRQKEPKANSVQLLQRNRHPRHHTSLSLMLWPITSHQKQTGVANVTLVCTSTKFQTTDTPLQVP